MPGPLSNTYSTASLLPYFPAYYIAASKSGAAHRCWSCKCSIVVVGLTCAESEHANMAADWYL